MPQKQNKKNKKEDSKINHLQAQIDELQSKFDEEKNKRLQTMADFQNYRRRIDEEKSKFGLLANKMLVDSVLEILDDVQMARSDKSMDVERAQEVLTNLTDKLIATLKINGVERVDIKPGDNFDSSTMEAITTVSGDTSNKVVDVISGAYRHTQTQELIKTAKVVVSKTDKA